MKKGFTMIELLAVFTLLGIILLITLPKMTATLKKSDKSSYDNFIKTIELATEAYVADNVTIKKGEAKIIPLSTIINSGYLKSNLKNPKDNKKVSQMTQTSVRVAKNNEGILSYELTNEQPADTTLPKISVYNGLAYISDSNNVYTASDDESGIKSVTCVNTSRNNASVTTYSSIGVLGPNVITCTATDNAGNKNQATGTINIGLKSNATSLAAINGAYRSGSSIFVPSGGTQYGPYIKANKGCYHVWYFGNNLNSCPQGYSSYEHNSASFKISNLNYLSSDSNYFVYIPNDLNGAGLEVVINNYCSSTIRVDDYQIIYSGPTC